MKFFTAIIVVLLSLNIYSQADLDLSLTFITDENPQYNTWELNFGLDSTATNGIDPWLGEGTYPPDACGGWNFTSCIAFCFPPPSFNEDIGPRDYRFGILPYSGQIEQRLWISLGGGATQAEMFWDFPAGLTVHLEDLAGGILFELDIQGAGSYVITSAILNIFNRFQMIAIYDNVVPIELTSFNATILQSENSVKLNWTTATETNNSGFEILRFTQNDIEWNSIGFVPGFGTTTEPKSYSFIDENVTTGTYNYRLKQIDFDGSFEFSNEIEVQVDFTPKEFVLYQNYPNPFNPSTTIKYSLPVESQVRINIYNALGEVIEELVSKSQSYGNYEVTWNAQNYSSGIYYYSFGVNSADGSQSHREMKKIVFLK